MSFLGVLFGGIPAAIIRAQCREKRKSKAGVCTLQPSAAKPMLLEQSDGLVHIGAEVGA